jgi:ABC-type methionine transport system ATPase subunit
MMEEIELCLEDVGIIHRFYQRYLLESISFNVCQGERLGIVGSAEAGKTLLFRALNRLVEIEQGTITYRQKRLHHYSPINLRQQIVMVAPVPCLLDRTVAQTLQYPLQLRALAQASIQVKFAQGCDRCEIPAAWLPLTESQLSLAQRQWVSLSRALILEPSVLLLDEPTLNLEMAQARKLSSLLRQSSGTQLIISQDVTFLQQTCDRILWLEQGQIKGMYAIEAVDWKSIQAHIRTKSAQEDW